MTTASCWNIIGVRGDGSCPELTQYVHCRNCPVYSAAAAALLDGEAPAEYLVERTRHFSASSRTEEAETRAVVVFRVGAEWLGLPTSVVTEVADLQPIHTLPHRQNGVVLGLASVRGELLICVSLGHIVGVGPAAGRPRTGAARRRLLVLRREEIRAVCPVDEVYGIHRFHPRELENVPSTVAQAGVSYSTGLLPWRQFSVGILDDQLLFYTLKRSLG